MNTGRERSAHRNTPRDQAREWIVIRHPGRALTPALQKKWDQWIAVDGNLAEFKEYERIDRLLRTLPRRPLPSDAELHAQSSGASWVTADLRALREFKDWLRGTLGARRVPRVYLVALSAVLLLAIGLVLLKPYLSSMMQPRPAQERMLQTARGQQLRVTLPDGTVVQVGGDSRVSILFSPDSRHATVHEGEALFKVTHNPRVPFQVDVGAVRVTDVGTAFHVRQYSYDRQVMVDVTEGAVDVAPLEQGTAGKGSSSQLASNVGSGPVTVQAGQAVSADPTGRISPAHPADFQAIAWWHRVYREKPLGRVIEDMQLYFPRRIEYDPTLRSVPFTGIIDLNKTEEWMSYLKDNLPVEIDESDPQRVVIRCRQAGCQQR